MKNLWKNYNGLFILAAMIGGFCLILATGYAAEKVDEKTPPAAQVKTVNDLKKSFIGTRGQSYAKQLDEARSKRLLLEEALLEARKNEARLTAKLDELDGIYRQMDKEGLWIIDSKDAAK